MNSNPGPPWLSCAPAVAMAGMITSAASMAAIVSKSATRPAAPGISSSSGRYEPYIRVPFPATESEKNACPSANIHVFGSASTFGSMRKMYLYPSMAPGWHAAYMARMMNNTKNAGIRILLAFSIPLPTPNIRMVIPMASAMICHALLPNEDAIPPKFEAKPSISSGDSVLPVKAPIMYFSIQPMTTVYPMAIASAPSTGMPPSSSPSFRLPFFSMAIPNASIGPDLVARPKLISPITPVNPMSTTNIKYGMR